MTSVAQLERAPVTDLVLDKVLTPAVVFVPGGVDAILKQIADQVRATKTDISTPSGRDEIKSLAFKVARSKTALDKMGKELGQSHYDSWKAITAERSRIVETLDALKDEVRKPLTAWENLETERVAAHEAALSALCSIGALTSTEPSLATIDARLAMLESEAPRNWQEFSARAAEAEANVRKALTDMREAIVKREVERAELTRLRKEQAARAQQERDERIAAEAAERARTQAEAAAASGRARAEKEAADAIARAERAEADQRAAAAKAERDKTIAVEAERKRAADVKAAADAAIAKREANKKHVAKVNKEVADALVSAAGVDARTAMGVVAAIVRGDVPHAHISY